MTAPSIFQRMLSEQVVSVFRDDFTEYYDQTKVGMRPVAGRNVIGKLDQEEEYTYRNFIGCRLYMLKIARDFYEKGIIAVPDLIPLTSSNKIDEDTKQEMSYCFNYSGYLKEYLWMTLRLRLGTFSNIEICLGYYVVDSGWGVQ